MIKSKRIYSRGMTLVELLVAMTVLSLVIALATGVLFKIRRVQDNLDVKYGMLAEAEKIKKDIEDELRPNVKLVFGTAQQIKFLDINGDTVEYRQDSDSLFKNQRPLTALRVDTMAIEYLTSHAELNSGGYYCLDKNGDDRLDEQELHDVTGIGLTLSLHSPAGIGSKIHIKKRFAVKLRNLIKT